MRRAVKTRKLERFRGQSDSAEMPQWCYIGAFCLFLNLHPTDGDAKDAETSGAVESLPPPWISLQEEGKALSVNSSEAITLENTRRPIFDITGLIKEKREEALRHQFLTHLHEPPSLLKELASRVTEILDRISRNWALEGAKTIQNGEVRLRKLNKDLTEKIEELVVNGSKYGQHVLKCMNRTVFEMELNKILENTNECYSESLVFVQAELKKIEDEQKAVLERMDSYGRKIFDMLSTCFFHDDTPRVIECLQKVDSIHIGKEIRDLETTQLIVEMAGIINNIPRRFSECTSKGLSETEVHLRKGYAQSLTCLKENYLRL